MNKLRVALSSVIKPAAKLVGGCELTSPPVNPSSLFAQAARPEAIDQNPHPIFWLRRVIDALDPNHELSLALQRSIGTNFR